MKRCYQQHKNVARHNRATQKLYIFLVVYLTGRTPNIAKCFYSCLNREEAATRLFTATRDLGCQLSRTESLHQHIFGYCLLYN